MSLLDAYRLAVPAREDAVATEGAAGGEPVLVDEARPAGEGAAVAHGAAGWWRVAVSLDAAVPERWAPLEALAAVHVAPVAESERAGLCWPSVDRRLVRVMGYVEARVNAAGFIGIGPSLGLGDHPAVELYEAGHRGFPAGGQDQAEGNASHATSMASAAVVSTEDRK